MFFIQGFLFGGFTMTKNTTSTSLISPIESEDIDQLDFISNEFLTKIKGDDAVSSSMFDKIFVPSVRVPKAITMKIEESSAQIALQQMPLHQTILEKPYWKGKRFLVDIFGAICLADDRHFLDVVIAHGTIMNNASKYTLRQAVQGLKIKDADWGAYNNFERIDQPMHNHGVYFHISAKKLCKGLNIKLVKSARKTIQERLRRLKNMELKITPEVDGVQLHNKINELRLVGLDNHFLLDRSVMKGNDYNKETYSDLIIQVSSFYYNSLNGDGIIDRKRLQNHYVDLLGPNAIVDFYKMLDSHKRSWVHKQYLSVLVIAYFENKMATFGINRYFKIKQIFNQVVEDYDKLQVHFGITLQKVHNVNSITRDEDYILYHTNTAEEEHSK